MNKMTRVVSYPPEMDEGVKKALSELRADVHDELSALALRNATSIYSQLTSSQAMTVGVFKVISWTPVIRDLLSELNGTEITIKETGVYGVTANGVVVCAGATVSIFEMFINGVMANIVSGTRPAQNYLSLSGVYELTKGDVLRFDMYAEGGTSVSAGIGTNLRVVRIR